MKWIEVEFQGHKYRVPALKSQGRLWFHWQGETHVIDLESGTRQSARGRSAANSGVITAPMPGKVTKVNVKKGDAVNKGAPLIVMEAMKMEYTLAADRDGEVNEVSVQPGAQVGLGDVLVRVSDA